METNPTEQVNDMTSAELEEYLDNVAKTQQIATPDTNTGGDSDNGDGGDNSGGTGADATAGDNPTGGDADNLDLNDPNDPDNSQDEEYANIVDYLNKEHNLGLETDNLPEDMSREQEAEVISDLFQRTVNGVNNKLSQYQEIETLLEDNEVKLFLQEKAEGKSLRDIASQYTKSTDGMGDEAVIAEHLKAQYPDMEADEIAELVAGYKDKDKLARMAELARGYFTKRDKARAKLTERQEQVAQQQLEQQYHQDVASYQNFVNSTTNIFGVPLDDRMKQDIVTAAVTPDNSGMTYLEKALQTDEGTLLATAGVLYMKRLMNATASTEVNRRNKRLADRLFDRPEKLQGGGQEPEKTDFNPDVANTF